MQLLFLYSQTSKVGNAAIVLGYDAQSPLIESVDTPGRFSLYPQCCIPSVQELSAL